MLDEIKFIVCARTAPVDSCLRALRSNEAAKVRVALRLNRRLPSVLFKLAERAKYLEAIGVERLEATKELADEYRLRLEEIGRNTRSMLDFITMSIALIYLTAAIESVLGIISSIGVTAAIAMLSVSLALLPLLEQYVRPVRTWDYRLAFLASIPALLSYLWPVMAVVGTAIAVIYGRWYFSMIREADEEMVLAMRGRIAVAKTEVGKAAAEIVRTVKETGARDLEATAEYLFRLYQTFQESMRRSSLMRAAVVAAIYVVLVVALSYLSSIMAPLIQQASQQGGIPQLPALQLSNINIRPIAYLAGVAAMIVAGRMTESYAAVPIYSPLLLSMLFIH
ncbi:MAG: hypothetical protein QXU93_08010 [Thermoproteus sp.]